RDRRDRGVSVRRAAAADRGGGAPPPSGADRRDRRRRRDGARGRRAARARGRRGSLERPRRGAGGTTRVLTVVKVGGGIGEDALRPVCIALGELALRHPLLVVPGGAGFADAVRDADGRFGLRAGTAHRMAILGMEQFGWLLSDLIPDAVRSTELRA